MKSALLISVQGIGNTVLNTPVIRMLTDGGYSVDVVVSDNGSHEVLRLLGDVRKQYLWRERHGAISNVLRLSSELRRERYSVAYGLYPNGKRENALLSIARAERKARYTDPFNYYRLLEFLPATHKVPLRKAHDVNKNLQLLQLTKPSPGSFPELSITESSHYFAEKFYSTNRLKGKFVIVIQPGGGGLAKRWSPSNYRDLCCRLLEDESISVLVLGSSREAELVEKITGGLSDRAIGAWGLSIDKVAALIAKSGLLLGNDSALAHLASALDVPVVVIWGYTDYRRGAPLNTNGIVIRIDYPCSPCYEFAKGYIDDCQFHLKCIKDISVSQVHRIVSRYISSLKNQESLLPEIFANEPGIASLQRIEGGCLKLDLVAA